MSSSLTMAIIPYSKPLTSEEFVKTEFEKFNINNKSQQTGCSLQNIEKKNKSSCLLLPCNHKVGQEVVEKINELAKRQNKNDWTVDFWCAQCFRKVTRIQVGQHDVIISRSDEELRRMARGSFPRPFPIHTSLSPIEKQAFLHFSVLESK